LEPQFVASHVGIGNDQIVLGRGGVARDLMQEVDDHSSMGNVLFAAGT